MAIQPGDILRGKYRLDALIGRGGMGNVYAATELATEASSAIKVVSRLMFDDVLMARLQREAEAASKIHSDFVPRVLEVSDTEDGEVFLVMERLVGESLSARLRRAPPVEWKEIAQAGEDILRGLIDAHTAGIVHRDLKPSNVFLALKQGRIRAMVLDFGVCKMDGVDTERLTATGDSIGTVAYMAPEQIRGASTVDDRADLYAFGALAFEMATGRLPHDGPSQMAILASKLENEAARLEDHVRIDVPLGLGPLVARALLRDPSGRPASAQELLRGWRALGGTTRTHAPRSGRVDDGSQGAPTVPHDEAPTSQLSLPPEAGSSTSGPPASRAMEVSTDPSTDASSARLTSGISLRKGGTGRLAVALSGCGLALGFIAVAVFFARGEPSAPARGASQLASSSELAAVLVPPSASALAPSVASTASDFELPNDEPALADAGHRPSKARAPRPPAPPRGPHITGAPRY